MQINVVKSIMLTNEIKLQDKVQLQDLFPYACKSIDKGLKYLGFTLKPNPYRFED
jgi:hypothetical protein